MYWSSAHGGDRKEIKAIKREGDREGERVLAYANRLTTWIVKPHWRFCLHKIYLDLMESTLQAQRIKTLHLSS